MKVNGKSRVKEPSASEKGKALDQCFTKFPFLEEKKTEIYSSVQLVTIIIIFCSKLIIQCPKLTGSFLRFEVLETNGRT